MDKIAQIKLAETHGVLAALADTGLLKVASEEDFDFMTEKVAEALGDDYDMDQVISKTAGCEYLMDKIASEEFSIDEVAEVMDKEACTFADLGEFLMLKEAKDGLLALPEAPSTIGKVRNTVSDGVKNTIIKNQPKIQEAKSALKDVFSLKDIRSKYKAYSDATKTVDPAITAYMDKAKDIADKAKAEASAFVSPHRSALLKSIGKAGLAYGIPTAAALYGGKKLYDRFKSDK